MVVVDWVGFVEGRYAYGGQKSLKMLVVFFVGPIWEDVWLLLRVMYKIGFLWYLYVLLQAHILDALQTPKLSILIRFRPSPTHPPPTPPTIPPPTPDLNRLPRTQLAIPMPTLFDPFHVSLAVFL